MCEILRVCFCAYMSVVWCDGDCLSVWCSPCSLSVIVFFCCVRTCMYVCM